LLTGGSQRRSIRQPLVLKRRYVVAFGTNSDKWTIWAIYSFLPPYNVYLTWLAMRLAH